ncbi:MAG: hypothetical protein M1294_11360 [Firmicutes bacterium]|jgi:Tfp pilus assembly protein PilE|nr:hypothetical protein [Bacillota bacterium]
MTRRQKLTTAFVVVVAVGAVMYFVAWPAYIQARSQTLIREATQVLRKAHQRAEKHQLNRLTVADIGSVAVSAETLYLFTVMQQSSYRQAQQMAEHPTVSGLQAALPALTRPWVVSQYLVRHHRLPASVPSSVLQTYRHLLLTEMAAPPVRSWTAAMQVAQLQHPVWLPSWYWQGSYQMNAGLSHTLAHDTPAQIRRFTHWMSHVAAPQAQRSVSVHGVRPVIRRLS